jgi:hypothetical protein
MAEPTQAELNRIELLKRCLAFYANTDNYENNQINLDRGEIARQTLNTVAIVEKSEADMIEQYSKMEQNLTPEDLIKQVREISEQFNKK